MRMNMMRKLSKAGAANALVPIAFSLAAFPASAQHHWAGW
jgi:Spy/CpxP family protein refolding chaperone